MKPRLGHWRCSVCGERGNVVLARAADTLVHRILAEHFERSPACELAPQPSPVAIAFDGHGWVLRRPAPEAGCLVPA